MNPTKNIRLILASTLLALCSQGSIIPLTGGDFITTDPLVGPNNWTLDLGYRVPTLPDSVDRVLFESGGDGTGISLTLLGSNLTVYQDTGDFNVSTPAGDTFFSVDIASFASQTLSIRLVGDTTLDTLQLDVYNGTTTLSSGVVGTTDLANSAGANDTGVGGLAADLAGLDESVEAGFPAISSLFNNAHRVDLGTMGADVLLGDVLIGILYTDTNLPPSIPEPGSWGLIPEPSSGGLFALGVLLLGWWRRTA